MTETQHEPFTARNLPQAPQLDGGFSIFAPKRDPAPIAERKSNEAIARDWTSSVRDRANGVIDVLVARLMSLKAAVNQECDITNHRMANYMALCDDAIRTSDEIEVVVKKLEQSGTFTEVHTSEPQQ